MAWGKIWTGPLDPWTIFWTFFGPLFGPFLDLLFDHFIKGAPTISTQGGVGCSLSVLRERWETDCCYSGRGGRWMKRGGVEDEWKEEGWEVVIGVNATDWWSFYWIIHIFWVVFQLTDWLSKFFSWAVMLGCSFVMQICHLNTGLRL